MKPLKPKLNPTEPYYVWKRRFKSYYMHSSLVVDESDPMGFNEDAVGRMNDAINKVEHDAQQIVKIAMIYGKKEGSTYNMEKGSRFLDEILISTELYTQFACAWDLLSYDSRRLGIEPYVDIQDPRHALSIAVKIVYDCAMRPLQGNTGDPINDETDPKRLTQRRLEAFREKYKPWESGRERDFRLYKEFMAKRKAEQKAKAEDSEIEAKTDSENEEGQEN